MIFSIPKRDIKTFLWAMAHFQSFACYKLSFDMRIVTCCWEKTLCDSVKYKNSPVGSLMWTLWCLLFSVLLSASISGCVWKRLHLVRSQKCSHRGASVSVHAFVIVIASVSCFYDAVPTTSPVWYYTELLTSLLLPYELVCLCLCLAVYHFRQSFFFLVYLHRCVCNIWSDRQTIQWKQMICPREIVYYMCVCVVSVCVFKAIWFNDRGILSRV